MTKPLTRIEYLAIKKKIDEGKNIATVAQEVGRSTSTVWAIAHTDSQGQARILSQISRNPSQMKVASEEMIQKIDTILDNQKFIIEQIKLIPKRRRQW